MEMITVLYTHQSKKLELELDPERPISHLMDRLEEITDVPVGNMKGTFCSFRFRNEYLIKSLFQLRYQLIGLLFAHLHTKSIKYNYENRLINRLNHIHQF